MLPGKKDVVMIHRRLASLRNPINIVAADNQDSRNQDIKAFNKYCQELLMKENCINNSYRDQINSFWTCIWNDVAEVSRQDLLKRIK